MKKKLEIKKKKEIKYFSDIKSKEKIKLDFELINSIKDNIYSLKVIYSDNSFIDTKISDQVKSSSQNSSLYLFELIYDYKFEKEQKLMIEIKINNNKKVFSHKIQTSIGEIIGNENKDKNGIKIYNLKGFNQKLKIKSEKIKANIQFVLIHFIIKIVPEVNIQKKYEILKNKEKKIYYEIERDEKKIYESEAFTDNGKFNIVQIPLEIIKDNFKIIFYNYKNRISSIDANVKDFTDPEKKGQIIFTNRISMTETLYLYNFSLIREEITFLDYISKGVRIGLNIGIDFSQSNGPTNEPSSLHCLLKEKRPNPYERAISSCAKILEYYDYDKLFPVYGFGAVIKGEYKTSMCFNINFKEDPNIQYVENIIKEYVNCISKIDFSLPTYFAPIINKIINDIKNNKDILDYQLLMILTDGIILDLEDTIEALVEGSFYPLSVIIIGIGNADFSKMEKLDGDEIPLISKNGIKRLRDVVQFVPFSKFEKDENKLINQVLEEIPRQIIDYYTFNFLYPEVLNEDFINKNNIINQINKENPIDVSFSEDNSFIFGDASFMLFEQNNKKNNMEKEERVWNYDDVNLMFKNLSINNNYSELNIGKQKSQKFDRATLKFNLLNNGEKIQNIEMKNTVINNKKTK